MIIGVRHTGLVVQDWQRALHFWCDLLGFKVATQMEESGPHIDAMMALADVQVRTAKLRAPDGQLIELLHFKTHADTPRWTGSACSTGFTHVALTVSDIAKAYERLSTAGVEFNAPPQLSPDGKVKVTYCRGPEGVLLELVQQL